ncbi:unnamed protein product [Dimorphilus gyrociliatus]|uniref:Uncharacterized protein n=1 Tax=Dimorphilus gyrociliatus TaxID=2664684 RepID=A0A7I8W4F7_9ANNE|nr:unnamed protein product [Dimorphilus gyrociliatus]
MESKEQISFIYKEGFFECGFPNCNHKGRFSKSEILAHVYRTFHEPGFHYSILVCQMPEHNSVTSALQHKCIYICEIFDLIEEEMIRESERDDIDLPPTIEIYNNSNQVERPTAFNYYISPVTSAGPQNPPQPVVRYPPLPTTPAPLPPPLPPPICSTAPSRMAHRMPNYPQPPPAHTNSQNLLRNLQYPGTPMYSHNLHPKKHVCYHCGISCSTKLEAMEHIERLHFKSAIRCNYTSCAYINSMDKVISHIMSKHKLSCDLSTLKLQLLGAIIRIVEFCNTNDNVYCLKA